MNSASSQLEALPVVSSSSQQLAPVEGEDHSGQRRLTHKQFQYVYLVTETFSFSQHNDINSYLFISQAMGAAFIDGAINFAFGTGVCHSSVECL